MALHQEQTTSESLPLVDQYTAAIIAGDLQNASRVVDQSLAMGLSPLDVMITVLVPAQVRLGKGWEAGEVSISEEHRGTQITVQQLSRLRERIRPKPPLNLSALVTTLEGDLHVLGASMISQFFYADGWNTDYLGPNTPSIEIVRHIEKNEPDIVVLSISAEQYFTHLVSLLNALEDQEEPPFVLLGGRFFDGAPESLLKTLYENTQVAIVQEPYGAVRKARSACGISITTRSLDQLLTVLGKQIQSNRVGRGWSQQKLAKSSKLDRAYLSSVENGKKNITVGALLRLAEALDVDIVELLEP